MPGTGMHDLVTPGGQQAIQPLRPRGSAGLEVVSASCSGEGTLGSQIKIC